MQRNRLLSLWTYFSRYARPDLGCVRYQHNFHRLMDLLGVTKSPFYDKGLYDHLSSNYILFPSMRGVQFLDGFMNRHERLYNCAGIIVDHWDKIHHIMYLLLCGSGVGFNICKKHVEKMTCVINPIRCARKVHVVEDSVLGWAKSVGELIRSYTKYGHPTVEFDYSNITPAGATLRSCGRPAPGPEPLMEVHKQLRQKLDKLIGKLPRPIDIYDIVCIMSSGVVAGGVRRSALIALFDPTDEDMMNAKVGNWWEKHPYRSLSNNSFVITPEFVLEHKENLHTVYRETLRRCLEYGEPGVVHLPSMDHTVNPCCEIVFHPWVDGVSSYQMCNLTEVSVYNCKGDVSLLEKALEQAAVVGTHQAQFTEFICPVAKAVTERDALLGVSLTGLIDYTYKLPWERFSKLCVNVNQVVAKHLGVQPASRVTCIKPSGTVSCLAGHSSGAHPWFNDGLRNVLFKETDPVFDVYRHYIGEKYRKSPFYKDNVYCCPFPYRSNGTKWSQVDPVTMMENVKHMTKHWVNPGVCREKSNFSHSVSCTIMFSEQHIEEMSRYLVHTNLEAVNNGQQMPFVGLSFLNNTNKYESLASPFCSSIISKEAQELFEYLCYTEDNLDEEMVLRDLENAVFLRKNNDTVEQTVGCDGDQCLVKTK